MLKQTLILALAYVAAVSCAIIPVAKPEAETEYQGCPTSVDGSNPDRTLNE
ncbi:uncharacterized protein EV154DRAFT_569227 [Mucor mucedo]|uniref:uncharacterized protein n=1 Tax=Mucor mucedo TaxID=29922 RepID=UPI00221F5B4E|nr:uncharacterized protein EV154DRAFT_569227 [Mucor mucedo]KAI7876493.1 hypothetical protein EV154DRAFT_569227 [Mucor mucedo]